MIIGYGRVSTLDQSLDSQQDALREAGCEKIFVDKASGKSTARPQLAACLAALREGDVLVITRLSRLTRSLRDLMTLTDELEARGVALRSLHDAIDTSTAAGKFLRNVLGAVNQFQRDVIADSTREGLAAARARGRTGGRPAGLDGRRVKLARQMKNEGESIVQIAKTLKVSRATIYRALSD